MPVYVCVYALLFNFQLLHLQNS